MANQHRCVFVGNIPYDATEEQLIQICEEVGPVVSFRLVIDRETGKPKGYGFCEYKDEETALSARRNLQGYEINGRQLRVDFAENDKGIDKSREQGRGGPGLTLNADGQRSLGGPAILGDTTFYQPIGPQLSSVAASVMAGALGGVQIDNMSSKQNGLQSQSGFANDPLTLYLANMSKKQLSDILSEMKVMATQNKELAQQLLSLCPLLPKALFQAQIILGMVTPQVLQMPNIRQSANSFQPLQDGMQDQKLPVLPPYPGQLSLSQNNMQLGGMPRVQEGQGSAMPPNTLFNNQPFPQASMQSRFQNAPQVQGQPFLPTSVSSQPGASTVPSQRPPIGLPIRSQPPSLESSTAQKQQMQAPTLHNPRSAGVANNTHLGFPNSAHHSVLSRPLSSQPNYLPGSSNSLVSRGMPDNVNKHGGAQLPNEATWLPGSNSNFLTGLPEQQGMAGKSFDPTHHPPKLAKLEDGRSAVHTMAGQNTSSASGSATIPFHGAPSLRGNQIPSTETMQNSDKQILQLPPEMHSALLEQVKSLTPEQLSSLPPEQRQQVMDLQKMLSGR